MHPATATATCSHPEDCLEATNLGRYTDPQGYDVECLSCGTTARVGGSEDVHEALADANPLRAAAEAVENWLEHQTHATGSPCTECAEDPLSPRNVVARVLARKARRQALRRTYR